MPLPELPPGTELAPDGSGGFRYEVLHLLGGGGFSLTYRAMDRRLESEVVIKEFAYDGTCYRDTASNEVRPSRGRRESHERMVEKFEREARLINRLRTPYVVRVIDVWRERGTAFYAMDPVDGSGHFPEAPLREGGQLNWPQIERWATQLFDALEAIHNQGVIHGDVKPENVMITRSGDLVLIDFGAARTSVDLDRTATSMMFTPGYAAPELMNPRELSGAGPWSDIYAAGLMLVGVTLGHPDGDGPINANDRAVGSLDPYADYVAHATSRGVPMAWARAISRCIELSAGLRPHNVAQLRQQTAFSGNAPPPRPSWMSTPGAAPAFAQLAPGPGDSDGLRPSSPQPVPAQHGRTPQGQAGIRAQPGLRPPGEIHAQSPIAAQGRVQPPAGIQPPPAVAQNMGNATPQGHASPAPVGGQGPARPAPTQHDPQAPAGAAQRPPQPQAFAPQAAQQQVQHISGHVVARPGRGRSRAPIVMGIVAFALVGFGAAIAFLIAIGSAAEHEPTEVCEQITSMYGISEASSFSTECVRNLQRQRDTDPDGYREYSNCVMDSSSRSEMERCAD